VFENRVGLVVILRAGNRSGMEKSGKRESAQLASAFGVLLECRASREGTSVECPRPVWGGGGVGGGGVSRH